MPPVPTGGFALQDHALWHVLRSPKANATEHAARRDPTGSVPLNSGSALRRYCWMHFSFQATNGALLLHQKLTNIQLKDRIQFTKKTKNIQLSHLKTNITYESLTLLQNPRWSGVLLNGYGRWRDYTSPFSGSAPPNAGSVLKTYCLISFSF